MSMKKELEMNVYEATLSRLEYIFKEFPKVYLTFSGGKDSNVLLQLAINVAERFEKLPVGVLYIDFEAQYQATIAHVEEMLVNNPKVKPYWICLPLNLRNAVSVYQSQWQCWNPDEQGKWVRERPKYNGVISDITYFPFFRYGMEFEEFIIHFGTWFSNGQKTACLVAIRADESLNRFRTIKSTKKERYENLQYSTKISEQVYNFYPIYDWKTEDIWTTVGKLGLKYNKIYDRMYQHGTSIHLARLCQPYGDDQRKGLELFRYLEPETWAKVVDRVSGANYGNLYANTLLMGQKKILLPEGHSWKSYVFFLLETLPKYEAIWYKGKFQTFLNWWAKKGYPLNELKDGLKYSTKMPDEGTAREEANKMLPSWRRLAKVILKNDKLCKSITFAGTKGQYNKYLELKKIYGY